MDPLTPAGRDAERRALLRLSLTEGLGPVRALEGVARAGSAQAAVADPRASGILRGVQSPLATPDDAERVLAECDRLGITCLGWHEPGYPRLLAYIDTPPPVLFVMGSVAALSHPVNVAIVGSRRATVHGRRAAEDLGRDLARAGVAVFSGLALGIDGAAHLGALAGPAPTVAVVAGGVESAQPPSHRRLRAAILEAGGAVVGENPPGTPPLAFRFPVRNRLLAGLVRAVVVVEAAEKSGALVTVDHAGRFGRDVLAVPGPIDRSTSRGTNRLLRDGAPMVLGADDVLAALGLAPAPDLFDVDAEGAHPDGTHPEDASPDAHGTLDVGRPVRGTAERRIWDALVDPCTLDEIVQGSGLAAGDVLGMLTQLELDGCIRRDAGMRFERVR